MNRVVCFMLFVLAGCSARPPETTEQKTLPDTVLASAADTANAPCPDFNTLNTKIRDGKIKKEEALQQLQQLFPQLKKYYYEHGGKAYAPDKWIFPVQGYTTKNIGGTNGSGYIASGYDYFKGNKHGGHAAHDIFIADKNQDDIDDLTKKPVNVLSMSGGIVVATATAWDTASDLRGGHYIWVYDPSSGSLFYYAHNQQVFVSPCTIVKPGDTLATIGRTGANAYKKRSPTHLHFMQLKTDSTFYPKPVNCYEALKRAGTK